MPNDTRLSPQDERKFQEWAGRAGRLRDLMDYDMRGAWQSNAGQAGNGHYPDTYKKPNHPTFSRESQYSTPDQTGGEWIQTPNGWVFAASPLNMNNMGAKRLSDYFQQNEPNATPLLPIDWSMR